MSFKILVCLCVGLSAGVLGFEANKERIVGGSNANIKDFPYQVSLRRRNLFNGEKHFCGGSIISERHILTAAHCVQGVIVAPYTNVRVYTGSSQSTAGQAHKIKKAQVHPDYEGTQESAYHNDVAVLTLEEPIKFDENQKTIDLPTSNVHSGDDAIVTGWGIQKYPSSLVPVQLKKAAMKIVNKEVCETQIGDLNKEQVCAVKGPGVGVCSGDSGGPLAVDNKVVGIASFVIPCGLGYPDVYTNVYYYLSFIKKVMNQ